MRRQCCISYVNNRYVLECYRDVEKQRLYFDVTFDSLSFDEVALEAKRYLQTQATLEDELHHELHGKYPEQMSLGI